MSAVPTPTELTVRVTGYIAEDGPHTILRGIVMASDTHSVGGTEVTVSLDTTAATALLHTEVDGTSPAHRASISDSPTEQPPPQEPPKSDYIEEDAPTSSSLGLIALVCGVAGFAVAMGPRIFSVFGLALGLVAMIVGVLSAWKGAGAAFGYAGFFFGITACFVALGSMTTMQDSLRELQREVDSFLEDSNSPLETW